MNKGVGGWVAFHLHVVQIEKNVQFNGRPLTLVLIGPIVKEESHHNHLGTRIYFSSYQSPGTDTAERAKAAPAAPKIPSILGQVPSILGQSAPNFRPKCPRSRAPCPQPGALLRVLPQN